MTKIISKFFFLVVSLICASIVIFLCTDILPGDTAQFILGTEVDEVALQTLRKELGLHYSWYQRYFFWIFDLLQGDLGKSYLLGVDNALLLKERLAVTLPLIFFSLLISLMLAYLIGLVSIYFQKKWLNRFIMSFLQIGIALPSFWIASLLILFFAVKKGWLPAGSFPAWNFQSASGVLNSLKYLILPIISLSIPQTAIFTRIIRNSLLDTAGEDFIKTALSKGLTKNKTLFFHILPYAQIPIITIVSLQIPFLLTGAVLVESVFYLPGMGRLILQAIHQRDLILVKNAVLLLFVFVIFIQFLAQMIIMILNPEITKTKHL